MDEKRSRFRALVDYLRKLLGKKPATPGDPYAYVPAPLRRGPRGVRVRRWRRLRTIRLGTIRREGNPNMASRYWPALRLGCFRPSSRCDSDPLLRLTRGCARDDDPTS